MAVQLASQSGVKTSVRYKNALGNNSLPPVPPISFAVVAGGGFNGTGSDSQSFPGFGGAGGFRKSFASELSGGGANSETPFQPLVNETIVVTVGGAGSNSSLGSITSIRGGNGANVPGGSAGGSGGSGGGGRGGQSGGGGTSTGEGAGGPGTAGQGFAGNSGGPYSNPFGDPIKGAGGAGGGAGGSNGAGLATLITGNSQVFSRNTASAANTGNVASSGIVIVRYPSSQSILVGPGLTHSTITVDLDKVTTFIAGTGSVSWTY